MAYHWRTNLAVGLAVAVATATLTGALLVGDSVRGTLRDTALRRLGPVDHALVAQRFFRQSLAAEIAAGPRFQSQFDRSCSLILMRGSASHADSLARVNRVNVLGVDRRFWALDQAGPAPPQPPASGARDPAALGRSVILNRPLADELGAKPGDDVLLRLEKHHLVPIETLLGRPNDTAMALRLTVEKIIPAEGMGGLGLELRQPLPRNAFVPLHILQRVMKQPGRANAILVTGAGRPTAPEASTASNECLQELLKKSTKLEDFNLRLRRDEVLGYVSLETDRLLLEPPVEGEALDAAQAMGAPAVPILTYLANSISRIDDRTMGKVDQGETRNTSEANPQSAIRNPQSTIPYSTVTAIDPASIPQAGRFILTDGRPAPELGRRDILLNDWAAADLQATPGDCIGLTYYLSQPFGRLETVETTFTLRGIVEMQGWAADRALTPQYEGITDAQNLSDWDPPFPVDMGRIREVDERYWDEHRATPKALISLGAGHELWAMSDVRFGRLTAIRFGAPPGMNIAQTAAAIETQLLERLYPKHLGLSFRPARHEALAASQGSTDFGRLFIAFSFFLILSAAMLVALIFRLGVERRAAEIGTLFATGFSAGQVRRMLLTEGAVLAGCGTALGLLGASGYAWLMLAGLRSWWSEAVGPGSLQLHASLPSFAMGLAASFLIALLSIAWAIRGLSRMSPRALLAGVVQSGRATSTARQRLVVLGVTLGLLAVAVALPLLSLVADLVPQTAAFFGSGAALLAASFAGLWIWSAHDSNSLICRPGIAAVARLGLRNTTRHRSRSLLTVALIASATFVIVAVGANRHGAVVDATDRRSPTGGFALVAEAAVPLPQDLNTAAGRESLNLDESTTGLLTDGGTVPFRLKPGDDASCLNLYKVRRPRILGATEAMIGRGGFEFASSLAETPQERANPWSLLRRSFDDGAVPAIGDYNTVKWLLHLGLGKDLVVIDERGRPGRLRFVGMLAGSVLQSELVISEARFLEMFPSISGYAFFLFESPPAQVVRLERALEHDLSPYGLDVAPTTERLAEYRAVENTYLSTFQTLGGLGLLLGTLGLAAVMSRNVFERRGELALLRALGFRRSALAGMVFTENAALLILGLATGGLSALLAIAPHASTSPGDIPWWSIGATLVLVLLVGLAAGTVALIATLRAPLLPALRAE
jgi:ABC-type lipoprotein release transport system permease subunit